METQTNIASPTSQDTDMTPNPNPDLSVTEILTIKSLSTFSTPVEK